MKSARYFGFWEQYHGRTFEFAGEKWRLKFERINAIFPYPELRVSVTATLAEKVPNDKFEVWDLLESMPEVQSLVLQQFGHKF